MRHLGKLKLHKGRYNFVPFIDLLFLLLIFFVLSSSFVQISSIKIELPETVAGATDTAGKLVVVIDKDRTFYFNDQKMELQELKNQLQNLSTRYNIKNIIIRADKSAPHDMVAKALALAKSIKLNVYIAVDPTADREQEVDIDNQDTPLSPPETLE